MILLYSSNAPSGEICPASIFVCRALERLAQHAFPGGQRRPRARLHQAGTGLDALDELFDGRLGLGELRQQRLFRHPPAAAEVLVRDEPLLAQLGAEALGRPAVERVLCLEVVLLDRAAHGHARGECPQHDQGHERHDEDRGQQHPDRPLPLAPDQRTLHDSPLGRAGARREDKRSDQVAAGPDRAEAADHLVCRWTGSRRPAAPSGARCRPARARLPGSLHRHSHDLSWSRAAISCILQIADCTHIHNIGIESREQTNTALIAA